MMTSGDVMLYLLFGPLHYAVVISPFVLFLVAIDLRAGSPSLLSSLNASPYMLALCARSRKERARVLW